MKLEKVKLHSQDIFELVKDEDFRNNFPELAEAYDNYESDYDFQYLSKDSITKYFAYLSDDEIVGIASYRVPEYSYLPREINGNYFDGLDVSNKYRGKGIGTYILNDITSSGVWVLYTFEHNYKFYENNNFELLTPNEEGSWAIKGMKITDRNREYLIKSLKEAEIALGRELSNENG